ncbi:MAG: polyprenyl diphosphate synthase [Candidatus Roizmanbacteria bacterium]
MGEHSKKLHHVAIIPDGNRRWAKQKGLFSIEGHRRGYEQSVKIARLSRQMDIKILTLWGFSTENWKRAEEEVGYLMDLFYFGVDAHLKEALEDKVRIVHIGRKDRMSEKLRNKIIEAEEKTKHFESYYLVLGLDYGGPDEVVRATKKMNEENGDDVMKYLDTAVLPFPNADLIIRTGGENRLSGFLSMQSAYAELMFVDDLYPDFSNEKFKLCIDEFYERDRRFGK